MYFLNKKYIKGKEENIFTIDGNNIYIADIAVTSGKSIKTV